MKKQPSSSLLRRALSVATGMRSMVEDIEECDVCGRQADLHHTVFLHGRFYCGGCANSVFLPDPSPVAVSML